MDDDDQLCTKRPNMTTGSTFPIVGVGASAGGLEPLQVLLGALPPEPGVGVVIVQHLSPTYPSALSAILSRATSIPVSEVVDETVVEPNRVYVIPPGRDIIIEGGCLKLIPQERTAQHRNIDRFFRSLAEDSGHLAIGVVLSGSASDGTLGLIAIKGEGGVTFAQDEGAQHDSMPRSAIASGCVDYVLPPARIAEEIARISRHPYVTQPKPVESTDSGQDEKVEQGHAGIANIVRSVIPALRTLLEEVLPQRHEVNDFEVVHTFDNLGPRTLLLNARRLAHLSDAEPLIILSLEDITEREEAAQAIRSSEERLRLSQEAARIGSFDWNLRTGVNVWSAQLEALYGLPTGGLPQDREEWLKLIHPEDLTGARDAIERAIRTGDLVEEEWRVIWPEGSERWLAARFQTVQDESGQPIRLVSVNLDITQRKQMEDDLRDRAGALARADRNKDEFLAMLAHELRNPLGGLRNASETLGADGSTREENEEARSIIRRQIENMARMLDDLLDVSRLTEGRVELQKKAVTLKDILTTATNLVHPACVANRQKATLIMPPEAIYLEADATRLEQVFGNLLNNACKYAGDGCHIEVVAGREEATDASGASVPSVRVTVRDNGAGIEGELLPHVFDLFRQASRTLDRRHGGLGIGLTLVRRLVELHGGTVEARSEGIGKGAEFVVILPILDAPPVTGQNLPLAVESTTSRRILIVDDNIDSATSLAMLQSYRGHETRTAFNGPDAISTAATFLPEVILLDIGLPGMDGFEVARQLRCLPPMRSTLIIAMSGYGRDDDKEEAARAGFDRYLIKPVDLNSLHHWIANYSGST